MDQNPQERAIFSHIKKVSVCYHNPIEENCRPSLESRFDLVFNQKVSGLTKFPSLLTTEIPLECVFRFNKMDLSVLEVRLSETMMAAMNK